MTTPRYDVASSRQSRLWSNRLWILAGLLGMLTAVHVIGVVHDDRAYRAALRATAQAAAEQHAERINERLQFLAAETFGPINIYGRNDAQWVAAGALAQLASRQLANERCRCKTTLPVAEFFQLTVGAPAAGAARDTNNADSARLTRHPTSSAASASLTLSASTLTKIARTQALHSTKVSAQTVHLTTDSATHDYAVVTTVLHDSASGARVVYGLVAPVRSLVATLVEVPVRFPTDSARHSPDADTLSLQIGPNDSSPIYGKLSDARQYRGRVLLHGPMEGLALSVALSGSQARMGQPAPQTDRLWALGALSVLTVGMIAVAGGTSRRETFLARARSDFIAGTSHDFRMPLAQILLASETLKLRPEVSDAERAHLTKAIVRETHRLIAMVENVLLFSRSGAVTLEPSLKTLDVREVFEDVQDGVQLAAEDLHQTIALEVETGLQVNADRQLLRQALVNLVDNAMKYGARNQTITLGAHAQSADLIHLWVDDHGPGIPESQRAWVFEPYERLLRDQASERAGSGLGLAVVSQIAQALRGRVWVETAPTGGARFVIALSAAQT